MDALKEIKKKGKCCISEKPLSTSKHVNMIQLNKKANWKYPVWGNFTTGERDMAIAYVHDDYIDAKTGKLIGEIKFAVEITNGKFIYHPFESL